ncbi:hypothetical protein ZWY2020_005106 [Hordeum vulgare]|nr:hypothetical protein ZWY2020_005106 [Hordeum vulgare]
MAGAMTSPDTAYPSPASSSRATGTHHRHAAVGRPQRQAAAPALSPPFSPVRLAAVEAAFEHPYIYTLFKKGFPDGWETLASHMEPYPNSCIHPQEDSAQFDLEEFQPGGSRFQEHNCGNEVSTKENSGASDDARPAAVANVEIGLNSSNTSQEFSLVETSFPQLLRSKTVGSSKKHRSAKQGPGRLTRLNLAPYVHYSRLTRSRAQSLSISTPESLKMRRTKSGRVIVPQLDPGRSWVVYDREGFISGVQNGG